MGQTGCRHGTVVIRGPNFGTATPSTGLGRIQPNKQRFAQSLMTSAVVAASKPRGGTRPGQNRPHHAPNIDSVLDRKSPEATVTVSRAGCRTAEFASDRSLRQAASSRRIRLTESDLAI